MRRITYRPRLFSACKFNCDTYSTISYIICALKQRSTLLYIYIYTACFLIAFWHASLTHIPIYIYILVSTSTCAYNNNNILTSCTYIVVVNETRLKTIRSKYYINYNTRRRERTKMSDYAAGWNIIIRLPFEEYYGSSRGVYLYKRNKKPKLFRSRCTV